LLLLDGRLSWGQAAECGRLAWRLRRLTLDGGGTARHRWRQGGADDADGRTRRTWPCAGRGLSARPPSGPAAGESRRRPGRRQGDGLAIPVADNNGIVHVIDHHRIVEVAVDHIVGRRRRDVPRRATPDWHRPIFRHR
jgi:hypothetical protein